MEEPGVWSSVTSSAGLERSARRDVGSGAVFQTVFEQASGAQALEATGRGAERRIAGTRGGTFSFSEWSEATQY